MGQAEINRKHLQLLDMAEFTNRRSKIVGVVGDVRRDMEGHHYAEKCSVFGISAEELKVLHSNGLVTRPREFSQSTDRYQVDQCPIETCVSSDAGERRTCIFTLQSHYTL